MVSREGYNLVQKNSLWVRQPFPSSLYLRRRIQAGFNTSFQAINSDDFSDTVILIPPTSNEHVFAFQRAEQALYPQLRDTPKLFKSLIDGTPNFMPFLVGT